MIEHSARRSLASRALVLGLLGAAALTSCVSAFAQPTTIAQDMIAATKRYVAEKSEEVIKAQSKRAIVAAYKKLYRSGADKRMLRASVRSLFPPKRSTPSPTTWRKPRSRRPRRG